MSQPISFFGILASMALWGLLLIGLYGGVSVSYDTFTNKSLCPSVAGVFVCYVVLASYIAMFVAQLIKRGMQRNIIFYIGWAIVFGVALLGTVLELGNGNTCPKSTDGLAMCYVSLAISATIGILFFMLNRK